MKVVIINGSPRKIGNTATLLNKAMDGAASEGAETKMIHLYDVDFKGCRSCLACKLKDGKSQGMCACNDGLTPILKKVEEADAIILGTPVYLGGATGEFRSFFERLMYPHQDPRFKKNLQIGFIVTMGANEAQVKDGVMVEGLKFIGEMMKWSLGNPELLLIYDAPVYEDPSKYNVLWDITEGLKRHEETFPNDCNKAFDMGVRIAKNKA